MEAVGLVCLESTAQRDVNGELKMSQKLKVYTLYGSVKK